MGEVLAFPVRIAFHYVYRLRLRHSFVAFTAILALSACKEEKKAVRAKVPVTVTAVETRTAPYAVVANGSVEPLQTVGVQSQISGILTRVNFREGDEVKAGQVLFEIDPRPFRAAADAAEAQLAKDQAQYEAARRQADRYVKLANDKSVTESEAESFVATARALAATIQADKAQIEAVRLNLDYATIRAPISGRTGGLLVKQGNLVRAQGNAPLVVINQLRPIAVRFAVPEREFPEILRRSQGTTLSVSAQAKDGGDAPLEGTLAFIDNAVDTTTGTVILKAHFANADGKLWPGQFVTVSLELYVEQNAVVVPADAVQTGQVGSYVFVVDSAEKAQIRLVTVRRLMNGSAIIAKGVTPGDRVITDGQSRLTPGAEVEIRQGVSAGNLASDTGVKTAAGSVAPSGAPAPRDSARRGARPGPTKAGP